MLRTTLFAALLATTVLPGAAFAATCSDGLKALRDTYAAGSVDDILAAVSTLRTGGICNQRTVTRATAQASGVLASRAGRFVAQGDLAAAEAVLERVPGLHWSVQAVRADIAAARGNRDEAAQLYNAALDTITDPALTPPDERLVPVAERLARLAQENMMLAGTLDSTITRGGSPSGVLKSAVRGIAIESYGDEVGGGGATDHEEVHEAPPKEEKGFEDHAEVIKEDHVDVPEIKEKPPEKEPAKESVKEKVVHEDPYASGKKEDYAVADGAAKAVTTVFLPIKFGSNSDHLDDKAAYEADYVGAFLKANKISEITLIGHTDERGSDSYNLDLSYRRAQAVRDYLTHYLATYDAYTYIHIDGKGERVPPKLSDPYLYSIEERQAIARRVELVLHK
ncbi:OmpA family protein [Marinovum sp. 2_MG-2023]|uniref:OmpA family protein n=1 Tax=unclassified Marinovum TaxID=2647166 RepID=UPI0026E42AD1|nr:MULTISPECIES: OmpA family protein [unclassified Marinovum]MDO6728616.1 OmpA family protein [Marinovum sp. 2_MG-2023]MDO6777968.1 OmpA family protein [Marinovum sp. 1_MG-2023]